MWQVDDQVIAFEPVVREVEHLAPTFAKITWIGYNFKGIKKRRNARTVKGENVDIVLLPRVGGSRFLDKILLVASIPSTFLAIWRASKDADVIHSRGPSLPSFCCIIISIVLPRKLYWHKYAGNWVAPDMPLSYRVQKCLLIWRKQFKVTINGTWPGQPGHLLSFENPCLTEDEIAKGSEIARSRQFALPLTLLFVGRVDASKGVDRLIGALNLLDGYDKIGKVIVVGMGDLDYYRSLCRTSIEIDFVGDCSRETINEFYALSHLLILPSLSEGFPKVVAEAAAFGCVPVVSNVSALSQYIDSSNGHLLASIDPTLMASEIRLVCDNFPELSEKSNNVLEFARLFTYKRYLKRIREEIIHEYARG
jgi:glycosyltransferase involved in cell wall biosynthesis